MSKRVSAEWSTLTKRLCQFRFHHGITVTHEQFFQLRKDQDNRCAICRVEFTSTPHLDHDHKTGRIRGLLCHGCNVGIGHLKENPRILENAIEYLRKNR